VTSPARRISYQFEDLEADKIKGQVRMPFAAPASRAGLTNEGIAELKKLWGDFPLACAYLDRSVANAWLTNSLHYPWVGTVTGLVGRTEDGTVALCLLGGEFSGRFKGLKLPTVMAGTSVNDASNAVRDVAERLDRLNARFRWGLVPQELSAAGRVVYAIEGTRRSSMYAKLAENERAGYTTGDSWLLFSSNVEGLTNLLLAANRRGEARADARQVPSGAPAYGWIDLEQGAKAIRLAITAYSFKLLLDDAMGSQDERQRLNEVKAWVDAMAPLKAVWFWMEQDGDGSRVTFDAGPS
jgi:hypothetical protein